MAKHATPLLDQLESGPWPSFVSDLKQEAAKRAPHLKQEATKPAAHPTSFPMRRG